MSLCRIASLKAYKKFSFRSAHGITNDFPLNSREPCNCETEISFEEKAFGTVLKERRIEARVLHTDSSFCET